MIIKIAKRTLSSLLSVLFLSLVFFSIPVSAVDYGEKYTYTDVDGTVFEYYLDENGYPFQMESGEKIFLLIPLEHLKITDEKELEELRKASEAAEQKFEAYASSKAGGYTWKSFYMDFATYHIADTGNFGFPSICHSMWLKTTNHNPSFAKKGVSFYLRWSPDGGQTWMQELSVNQNLSTAKKYNTPAGLQFNVKMWSYYGTLNSCTLKASGSIA